MLLDDILRMIMIAGIRYATIYVSRGYKEASHVRWECS